MNYSTYRFTLDLHKHQSQASIAVFKGDTAVRLCISLSDGGNPYHINDGVRAVFYGKRADGKPLIHPCMIKEQTTIVYDFEDTTTAVDGIVECEMRLYDSGNEIITAPRFIIVVADRLVNDTDIDLEGSPITALDEIFASEKRRVDEHAQMRETVDGFSGRLDAAEDNIEMLEEKNEWDHVITSLEDFNTENLATMSGRVLVKGVNLYVPFDYWEIPNITIPDTVSVIKFIDSSIYAILTGTKKTKIIGIVGRNVDTGAYFTELKGFGAVEFCENIDVTNCDNVRHCSLREATNCTNLNDITSIVNYGDGIHHSFNNCDVIDNVRIYGREDELMGAGVEFVDCSHISNVYGVYPDVPIDYYNCTFVDGDTCDGYYTAEDNGKVQTVNTDGSKSLIEVYTKEEIDAELGDLSTILTALHEGGIQ